MKLVFKSSERYHAGGGVTKEWAPYWMPHERGNVVKSLIWLVENGCPVMDQETFKEKHVSTIRDLLNAGFLAKTQDRPYKVFITPKGIEYAEWIKKGNEALETKGDVLSMLLYRKKLRDTFKHWFDHIKEEDKTEL